MSQPAKASEPSMEEILASIRRIIADDDGGKAAAPRATPATPSPSWPPPGSSPAAAAAPAAAVPSPQLAEPFVSNRGGELTESATAPPPFATSQTADRRTDTDVPLAEPRAYREPPSAPRHDLSPLIAGSTAASVDSAFHALAHTVLTQNARTLEDLVREMLRPMLKSWLDDNLPSMVERMVRAEIERISRGRA